MSSSSGYSRRSSSTTPGPSSSSTSLTSGNTSRSKSREGVATKPVNVFSNDGSFLDRIRRSMKEDEEKRKREEALERKKTWDQRFRHRGKRPLEAAEASQAGEHEPEDVAAENLQEPPSKKARTDETQGISTAQEQYHQAVESYTPTISKDTGSGRRPFAK